MIIINNKHKRLKDFNIWLCQREEEGHILLKRIHTSALPLKLPVSIQIEITQNCNCSCAFCYNNSGGNTFGPFYVEKWRAFLRSVVAMGGAFQYGFSGGEPLIYKDELIELFDIVHEDQAGLTLLTNGYYLTQAYIEKLVKYSWYWIQISLDSWSRERHDFIRGCAGCFDKAVDGIRMLKQAKIPVAISSVIGAFNVGDMEGIAQKSVDLGADLVLFSPMLPVGRGQYCQNSLQIETEKYYEAYDSVFQQYGNSIVIRSAQPYEKQIEGIYKGNPLGVLIRPNGDVKLDCLSHHVIGNIFSSPLDQIWKRLMQRKDGHNAEDYI